MDKKMICPECGSDNLCIRKVQFIQYKTGNILEEETWDVYCQDCDFEDEEDAFAPKPKQITFEVKEGKKENAENFEEIDIYPKSEVKEHEKEQEE